MSKKKIMIEIAPPARIAPEVVALEPTVCPYCNGRGRHYNSLSKDPIICPDCKGNGLVKAVVEIKWVPVELISKN